MTSLTSTLSRRTPLWYRPDQQQSEVELPQVAPGRYEVQVTASTEGPYFLNIVQQGQDGQALVGQPAGFVVPYSPEYRTLRANPDLLTQLAQATNGRTLTEASLTFDHSLPAEGSPREIWPLLIGLASLLFLFDIALRRLRLALLDLRRAGVQAGARLLGKAQAVAAPAQARLLAAKDRIVVDTPTLTGRPGQQTPPSVTRAAASSTPAANQPASASALSTRVARGEEAGRPRVGPTVPPSRCG